MPVWPSLRHQCAARHVRQDGHAAERLCQRLATQARFESKVPPFVQPRQQLPPRLHQPTAGSPLQLSLRSLSGLVGPCPISQKWVPAQKSTRHPNRGIVNRIKPLCFYCVALEGAGRWWEAAVVGGGVSGGRAVGRRWAAERTRQNYSWEAGAVRRAVIGMCVTRYKNLRTRRAPGHRMSRVTAEKPEKQRGLQARRSAVEAVPA